MFKMAHAGSSLLLGFLIGCGSSHSTLDPGPPPPHGGMLVKMPGGKGYVEIVKKSAPSGNEPLTGEVSFYLLTDSNTAFSPTPTSGTLAVGKKNVVLQAQGDALVTPSGPPLFPNREVDGELSVELDGKKTNIRLGVR